MEDMYERAEFAKEIGSVIVMIDLTVGYTAIQSMAKWARRNGVILHLHRAGHGTYTRQKTHGVTFRVICQVVPPGRRRPHPRRHRRRQARGRPDAIRGYYDTLRRAVIPADPRQGSTSTRTGRRCPASMPVASGGIHAGQMHQLLHYLGEDVVLQFGGGTIGHPMGIARGRDRQPGRRRGDDPGPQRGPRLLRRGRRTSWQGRQGLPRALDAALAIWKDITFDYESTDTPDVVVTPTAA